MQDVLLMREEEVDLLVVVRERLEHVPFVVVRQEVAANSLLHTFSWVQVDCAFFVFLKIMQNL